jgi:hypothetical protein
MGGGMTDWIDWQGGDQPVPDETMVLVRLRNGAEYEDSAEWLRWWHDENPYDTVAYRRLTENNWIEWDGGYCPVVAGTELRICRKDGEVRASTDPGALDWHHNDELADIVAYLVVKEGAGRD